MRSQVKLDVIHALGLGFTFNGSHFAAVDGQLVMLGRVEVLELVDAVQDIRNQLLQEQPWDDADLAAELPGHGSGQNLDVLVRSQSPDTFRSGAVRREEITDLDADFHHALVVKRRKPKLNGTRVVEAGIRLEIHMQPLGERFETPNPLWPVEERRGASYHQVQVREPASVNVVDQLPESVQPLFSHVAPHPLRRLDLVQDKHQAGVAGILEDQQEAPQEAEGGEVVHVPLDARKPLDRRCNVRLASEPSRQSFCYVVVVLSLRRPIPTQGSGKLRCRTSDVGKPLLQKVVGSLRQSLLVRRINRPLGKNVLLQTVKPAVDYRTESAEKTVGGA